MEGRLNRDMYIAYSLIFSLIFLSLIMTIGDVPILIFIIWILNIIFHSFLIVWRFHDLNMSGDYFCALIVPIYNIYLSFLLLFMKGTEGPNQYGIDPLNIVINTGSILIILSKAHVFFKHSNTEELIFVKNSISINESNDSYMFNGKDQNGTDIFQKISRKDLGKQLIKFKKYFSEYF